eukprot:TRINITY_DN3656_c0_g1_i1.p3 TRINITY_DN3656_c0_g1~~TRINITY_DN3656_c0_g1_i1.p3  ORF type:complete len:65 (+),score=0.62 TRINITY_DN3656_c0_g1_i1:465-659(+)
MIEEFPTPSRGVVFRVLDITNISSLRPDAHQKCDRSNCPYQDCTHYAYRGSDMWNTALGKIIKK